MSRSDGTVADVDPLASLRAPVPEPAQDERRLAPPHWLDPRRVAGAAMAVVLFGLVGYWLLRSPAPPVEATLPMAAATVPDVAAPTTPVTRPAGRVVVHVAGAVLSPGVYQLGADQRVDDAVAAAGGSSPTADLGRINLAAVVEDGIRIYVPEQGEGPVPSVEPAGAAGEDIALVPLNTATTSELETLPGVGSVTAAAIVAHRQTVGGFAAIDDLLDVQGIGDAKLEAIRPLVSL